MHRPHNCTERLSARVRVKVGSDRRSHLLSGSVVRMKADGAQTADSKAFPQKGGFLWHLVPMEAVVQDANH